VAEAADVDRGNLDRRSGDGCPGAVGRSAGRLGRARQARL